MPSRFTILAIIAFWLGTSGWLFYRDLWPWIAPAAPPPFAIDLTDEAQAHAIRWTVFLNDRRMGYAHTGTDYHEKDDTFSIWGEFKLWLSPEMRGTANLLFATRYVVTREGDLRNLRVDGTFNVPFQSHTVEVTGHVQGPVEEGRLRPHVEIMAPAVDVELNKDLDPLPIMRRGSLLNPLQPVNRIAGLRKGQHWLIPMVDPSEDLLGAAGKVLGLDALSLFLKQQDARAQLLRAEVLPQTESITFDRKECVCVVIEYNGANLSGRTWVREIDGLVLRQQVVKGSENLILQRET
jgi:hypothetical protein